MEMMDTKDIRSLGIGAMSAHKGWSQSWSDTQTEPEEDKEPPESKITVELLDILGEDTPGKNGGDYSDNVLVINVPILGRLHILRNKVGLSYVGFIVWYWVYGTWSTLFVVLKPHYQDGHVSEIVIAAYCAVSVLCICSLFRACTSNPGRIPFSREVPVSKENMTWNHCQVCRRRKPEKSHHCSRCGQCILRMDHHCPWINNCVGQENHWAFIQLLMYAFLLSVYTLIIDICHMYYFPICQSCDKYTVVAIYSRWILGLALILAIFMTCCMSSLICHQTFGVLSLALSRGSQGKLLILSNVMGLAMMLASAGLVLTHLIGLRVDMTTIDWMKLQQEVHRKGSWNTVQVPEVKKTCLQAHDDLCGPGPRWMWPFPCRRRRAPLYITYPAVV